MRAWPTLRVAIETVKKALGVREGRGRSTVGPTHSGTKSGRRIREVVPLNQLNQPSARTKVDEAEERQAKRSCLERGDTMRAARVLRRASRPAATTWRSASASAAPGAALSLAALPDAGASAWRAAAGAVVLAGLGAGAVAGRPAEAAAPSVDLKAVRAAIEELVEAGHGPLLVRLAWRVYSADASLPSPLAPYSGSRLPAPATGAPCPASLFLQHSTHATAPLVHVAPRR